MLDVGPVLLGIAEHELARPVQVGAGKTLIRIGWVLIGSEEFLGWHRLVDSTSYCRLRHAVQKPKMFMTMFGARPRSANLRKEREPCAFAGRLVEIGHSRLNLI